MGNAIFKSSPSGRSIVRGSFYRCVVVKCGPEGFKSSAYTATLVGLAGSQLHPCMRF